MKYKTSSQWYASPEHFRSEKSWEEYKASAKNRKPIKRSLQRKSSSRGFLGGYRI